MTAYHKGPPPIGSAWSNTQETRVVIHTYGTHANAYTVQFEVWRGFPELRRCGSGACNGQAWLMWLRKAKRSAHPADSGRDVGDCESHPSGDGSPSCAMEGRPAVDPDGHLVVPEQARPPANRETDRSGVVHLAPKQQSKKDRR